MRLNKNYIRLLDGDLFTPFFEVVNNAEANIFVFRQSTKNLSQACYIGD